MDCNYQTKSYESTTIFSRPAVSEVTTPFDLCRDPRTMEPPLGLATSTGSFSRGATSSLIDGVSISRRVCTFLSRVISLCQQPSSVPRANFTHIPVGCPLCDGGGAGQSTQDNSDLCGVNIYGSALQLRVRMCVCHPCPAQRTHNAIENATNGE